MKECIRCHGKNVVKNGRKSSGKQNYLCKECGYQFASDRPMATKEIKRMAVVLYCAGLSFRTIGVLMNYSYACILFWVREFAIENYVKPIPKEEIVIELDEMWHFLQSKKTNCGFGKPIVAQLDSLLTGKVEIVIPKLLQGCITG